MEHNLFMVYVFVQHFALFCERVKELRVVVEGINCPKTIAIHMMKRGQYESKQASTAHVVVCVCVCACV